VLGDPGRDQRVRQLEQQRPAAPGEQHVLGGDRADDRIVGEEGRHLPRLPNGSIAVHSSSSGGGRSFVADRERVR
jgi:hypothetical protein